MMTTMPSRMRRIASFLLRHLAKTLSVSLLKGILCQLTFQKSGLGQPIDEDDRFSPGAVLGRNAYLPTDRAAFETFLDGKDLKWRLKEANRKFVLIVDNCFPMRIADPTDESAIEQATE